MKIESVAIKKLRRPERNVRIHTEKQLKEFERSLTMFGQIRPIVVDESYTILAGVGCYETLVRMGSPKADIYRIEGLSENQKKKLMIADNKIFGLGIDDLDTFNEFLDELQADLDIPGYDEEILQSMVAVAEEVSEKIGQYGTIDENAIASMTAAAEKNAAREESAPTEERAPEAAAEPPAEDSEEGRFVIRPKCGEKIWL